MENHLFKVSLIQLCDRHQIGHISLGSVATGPISRSQRIISIVYKWDRLASAV